MIDFNMKFLKTTRAINHKENRYKIIVSAREFHLFHL